MLWKDKQINIFSTYPIPSLFGTWLKKEQYQLENPIHPITGKPIETPVVRTRVREGSFNWADWSEKDRITFTMSKFWPSRNDSMEGGVIPPMTGLAE